MTDFLSASQQRKHTRPALCSKESGRTPAVVASRDSDVDDLFKRVLAGLARLPLHEVERFVTASQDQVVQTQQNSLAVVYGEAGPVPLSSTRGLECDPNVIRGGNRN